MLGNMSSGIFDYIKDWPFVERTALNNWDVQFTADSLVKVGLKHPLAKSNLETRDIR